MAAAVATPLEKQFTRIAGITEMTSRSTVGSAQVTLQFELSRDINAAARDVQAAITASAGFLRTTFLSIPHIPEKKPGRPADSADVALNPMWCRGRNFTTSHPLYSRRNCPRCRASGR